MKSKDLLDLVRPTIRDQLLTRNSGPISAVASPDSEEQFTYYVSSTRSEDVDALPEWLVRNIINLEKINSIVDFAGFLRAVHRKIPVEGFLVGCFETHEQQKARIIRNNAVWQAWIINACLFIFKRVLPKLKWTKEIFRKFNAGRFGSISKAEALGRLVHAGFRIDGLQEIDHLLYVIATKTGGPPSTTDPSSGIIVKLKRVGKHGERQFYYKLRTMHPYAEFLQEFIYEQNKLQDNGKFNDDFRVTFWGKLLRKYWIDELPMLYNWFKGDMKLVGVRPLSEQYLMLYPDDLLQQRLETKPGLIPPFYADMPHGLAEIIESERRYLQAYKRHPWLTDIRYFYIVFYNIIFKKARSR